MKGFTLIELLVVVLIIGILAAAALPQYQVAVGKTQFTEMRMWGERIKRAIEMDFLVNGRVAGQWSSLGTCTPMEDLDIEIPAGAQFSSANTIRITPKITASRREYANCGIMIRRDKPEHIEYVHIYNPTVANGVWANPECRAYSAIGRSICKAMGAKPQPGNNIVFVFEN